MLSFTKISDSIINNENCPGVFSHVQITDGTNHCVLTEEYFNNYAECIKNMKIYEDDVWVITFPKCGTTWAQEIVWLLNNNLDYEGEQKELLDNRFPFVEFTSLMPNLNGLINNFDDMKRPRHIKSHLPKFLLPDQLFTVKPKIIYVVRNPKDAAVSYFHHYRHIFGYIDTKEKFLKHFVDNRFLHAPMNENVLEFWKLRNESNVLFLYYEDMKRNIKQEITKIMKFLDKSYSDDQINRLCQYVSFESMKNNPSCNRERQLKNVMETGNYKFKDQNFSFMRRGKVGSHDSEMDEETKAKFDEFMNCPRLIESGFSYKIN